MKKGLGHSLIIELCCEPGPYPLYQLGGAVPALSRLQNSCKSHCATGITGLRNEKIMRLVINGDERSFDQQMSVADLLVVLGVPSLKVAVELNRAIVPKSAYDATSLKDGDRLEVVNFVGGG
jgi:sulfur carrier protein